jgi:S1-C subfamily serine protease
MRVTQSVAMAIHSSRTRQSVKKMKTALTGVLSLFLCACASHTGVVPVGKDTFMIAKQQATGFPGLGNMKAEITAEGARHCASLGKEFQIVSTHETQPPYVLGNYPRAEIQFMCLAPKVVQQARPKPKEATPSNQFEPVGTGFLVNAAGAVITNRHVIEGCTTMYVLVGTTEKSAVLRAADSAVDLAVLGVDVAPTRHPGIRTARDDKLGETVIVAGYPLQGILSKGLNITTGTVSALAGLANNAQFLQITAPVQPGNSGGPVLDENGSVAGVVVSKLNAVAIAKWTGDIPQNVNFAIKSSVLRGFLEANGIDYTDARTSARSSVVKIAEGAKEFTLPIFCRK